MEPLHWKRRRSQTKNNKGAIGLGTPDKHEPRLTLLKKRRRGPAKQTKRTGASGLGTPDKHGSMLTPIEKRRRGQPKPKNPLA